MRDPLGGSLIDSRALAKTLLAAGFSTRTANAIAYSGEITSIDELRTAAWGDGMPGEGAGLWWRLQVAPNMGPVGIAQVLAFRNGDDPRQRRPKKSGAEAASARVHEEPKQVRDAGSLDVQAFAKAFRELSRAGLSQRAALLLASWQIENADDLRSRHWEGPGGLKERLAREPSAGPRVVKTVETWLAKF